MANTPKWTEDRTAALVALADAVGGVISVEKVADFAAELETSTRSIASKLRKLGYEVQTASDAAASAAPKFSDEQVAALIALVTENSGKYTYAEIAEKLGSEFTARQVQGKILSLELTAHVAPTPKKVAEKTYSDEEEAKFIKLVEKGATLEALAAKFDRPVNSVRGKALSLLRAGKISAIPVQENKKPAEVDPLEALGDLTKLTVEEIAEKIGKTVRGVKTTLTRRKLNAANYKAKVAE